jgi:hypothetical protein
MLSCCKPPDGSDWAVIEVEPNVLVFEYAPLLAGLVPGLPYKADCVLAGALRDQFVIQTRT